MSSRVRITNPDKVLYPESGTTKADLIEYAVAIAPAVLPLIRDRPLTRKRWPHGSAGPSFFEKNIPAGAPSWIRRVTIEHSGGPITYPLIDDVDGLVWLAQLAALEWHVPQWRIDSDGHPCEPDRLVVDLDPGNPAGLVECAEVALTARIALASQGLTAIPVTSGSKGIHVYAQLPAETTADSATELARALAAALSNHFGSAVTDVMDRKLRPGRVFVDWSQNSTSKTTLTPYSPRALDHATAAAPRDWAELENSVDLRQLTPIEVLERWREMGDLTVPLH